MDQGRNVADLTFKGSRRAAKDRWALTSEAAQNVVSRQQTQPE
jgi:hypothetical protein